MNDMVSGRQDGAPQRRRPRADSFTPTKRQLFLDALALTCNVKRSAVMAGIDHTTAYYNRVRDPVFAEQWRQALAAGYDRLEALVLEHGGAGEALRPADPDRAVGAAAAGSAGEPPPFDFDRALKVLQHYRSQRAGETWRRSDYDRPRATREETNAAIMTALDAAERRAKRREPGA